MVEILAPVGDEEMLDVAIKNGADAVYLGSNLFNARMKATNFNEQNLAEAIKKAHLFGVKVYLTLNTLICDSEVKRLLNLVNDALKAKVDAFIVQDLGVAYLIKKYFKDAVLHASTQLGIHNLDGALVAEKLGFKRVVLSRETTLEDIKQIKKHTNLEVEYFVHGALCVAFSGNCYLSSYIKNKSGNRGQCLQLCRLFYNGVNGKNEQINDGYLLSTRDLAYFERVKELIDAGVDSFKIEGRLKRPAYVAQTVLTYKKIAKNFDYTKKDEMELMQAFSRGKFNKGNYLDDCNEDIINKEIQNHLGLKIGKVINVTKFKDLHRITIFSKHKLCAGDGLKFVSKEGYVNSCGVGNVELKNNEYTIYSKTYPSVNDDVYLTVNKVLEDGLTQLTRKIKIDCEFVAKINQKPFVQFVYKKSENELICGYAVGQDNCETAKTRGITVEDVKKNLSKTKDTVFEIEHFNFNLDDGLFMPLVEINNLRRNALLNLMDNMLKSVEMEYDIKSQQELDDIENNLKTLDLSLKKQEKEFVFIESVNDIENQLQYNCENKDIIYSPEIYSKKDVANFKNKLKDKLFKGKIYYDLPIIENHKDLKILKDVLNENEDLGVVVNNIYGLNIAGKRDVVFGIYLNITNSIALKQLLEFYPNAYAFKSVEKFADFNVKNILTYNNKYALMTLKHCPYKLNYGTNCTNCSANNGLIYVNQAGDKFKIKRKKIANCYFGLYEI